jgi:starch phosphorylase
MLAAAVPGASALTRAPRRAGRRAAAPARAAAAKPAGKAAAAKAAAVNGAPDAAALGADIRRELRYRLASPAPADAAPPTDLYAATAWSVHNRLLDAADATEAHWAAAKPKRVYYLSAEFLMGRTLTNAVRNLGLGGAYGAALGALGADMETVASEEVDAALGNGGLGRLAACFLDSMATLDLPGWGYGIRYRFGMFRQGIDPATGRQVELPDHWLPASGNPWEVPRPAVRFPVGFYGAVGADGRWAPAERVVATAYDVPIPGYATKTVGNLRLWHAEAEEEFDLAAFNEGAYEAAVAARRRADDITAVLYPNDATEEGKELRLKQQFFFVSASLQDALARHLAAHGDLSTLADFACFQMNDTHPTIAVAELMRLLVDERGMAWDAAWAIGSKALAYTNHTVMPEALEKWPVAVMAKLLPRHMAIIERINAEWLARVRPVAEKRAAAAAAAAAPAAPADASADSTSSTDSAEEAADPLAAALAEFSIVQENPWAKGEMLVNMAYLAVVGSFAVNGVAAIHSEIIKEDIFPQFLDVFPEKFQNKTNGVTLRRWLAYCNPELSALISEALGSDAWVRDAALLAGLKPFADDAAFRARWRAVKRARKAKLAAHVESTTGYAVPVDAMFDVQVKRIHEYKRQLMNVVSLIARYQAIKAAAPAERAAMVPRVALIGGKAASAYYMAKKIVALVAAVGATVNADPEVGDLLKVVFLPNYNVTEAELIIPGAEVSQHISTAGTEASGTSNMKFALNGALIIGTMDGANIEIAENTGAENLFVFGVDAGDVSRLRAERKDFKDYDPRWVAAWAAVRGGAFGDAGYFADLADSVNDMSKGNDWFLVANDFADYMRAQGEVDALYRDQEEWTRRSIVYTASNGFFSSDRTIQQYADEIWGVEAAPQA